MTQLSALDGVFLSMETPETPTEIGGLAILDPSTTSGFDFERFVDFTAERLALCPRFSWKVQEVPFGLDLPYWIEDEELDLRHHIRRAALPQPGGSQELADLASHLFSLPLDRSRPLWEMYVIEGLQGGRAALLWKLHHCLMDGESGAGLVELLFDMEPEPATRPLFPVADIESPGEGPSLGAMVRRGFVNGFRRNAALVRNATGMVSSMIASARSDEESVTAPRASFNGVVGSRRVVAWSTLPLSQLKEVKEQLGVSVNDVILGITSGSIRRYLELRDELPEQTLHAMVPMSTRAKGDKTVNNQVRDMAVDWATDVEDPVERILRIHRGTTKAKQGAAAGSVNFIQGMAESFAPVAMKALARFGAAAADRIPLPGNAVVSNVRMTDFPLYIAGAKIVGMVPMSVLAPTQGLNITVVTYCGELHFGVIADPRLCPEPWQIAEGIAKSLVELQAAMDGAQRN
jgi:WS/DGAT/MGAT family acyltransferase